MHRRTDGPRESRRSVIALLAAIVAVAALVRFWAIGFGLPYTNARPDETIIIDVAFSFMRGNFHPAFFDYPWLYMWTLAGLYLLYYAWGRTVGWFTSISDLLASWRVHWAPFFYIPRMLSAVAGTLTVPVVFRIARTLWDQSTAVVAALFMALAFIHVRDSHFGSTDVSMTLLMMVSISCLMQGHLSKRRRDFVIGGFVGGLAAATKYNALLLAVPIVVSYLVNIQESADRRNGIRDPRLFQFGIPFLIAFLVGIPFLLFDLTRFFEGMKLLEESMEIGSRGLYLSSGWIHHVEFSLRYGLGLPLLVAGVAGMVIILVEQPRRGLVLLSFPIAYYLVAGSLRNLFFRYAIPLVPFLCLSAARAVTWTAEAAMRSQEGWLRHALTTALAIAIVIPSATSIVRFNRIASRADNRVVIARWFDEHVPDGTSVLMTGSSYGYVQFTRERHYEAWVWDRNRLAFVIDLDRHRPMTGSPEYILLQESPLPAETQAEALRYLNSGYDRVQQFVAYDPSAPHLYDVQDAFFMPYAGFAGVERPGPNYTLYRRRSGR
jgi:4-amino-4-deoxy-L-arabinose transferase-like glycosyltransferase